MRGDEAVVADPRRDLQGHPDVHILDLLLDRVDARKRDRGQDRQGIAGHDLGGRAALRGDSGLRDDPALALGDLGVERDLEVRRRRRRRAACRSRPGNPWSSSRGRLPIWPLPLLKSRPEIAARPSRLSSTNSVSRTTLVTGTSSSAISALIAATAIWRTAQDDRIEPAVDADRRRRQPGRRVVLGKSRHWRTATWARLGPPPLPK